VDDAVDLKLKIQRLYRYIAILFDRPGAAVHTRCATAFAAFPSPDPRRSRKTRHHPAPTYRALKKRNPANSKKESSKEGINEF
jgi:hypothetical protein